MAKIDHLSWSQVNTYLTCPREYYYRYIKYPDRKGDSSALRAGRAYHIAVEALYRGSTLSEAIDQFRIENQSEYKILETAIDNYYTQIYPLYTSYVNPKNLENHVSDFMIDGVDVPIELRLDMFTTDGRIIDHKTVGKYDVKAINNKQMLLYSYWYYKQFKILPRQIELHKAGKFSGNVYIETAPVTISDVLKVVDLVRNVYKLIQQDIFPCYLHPTCKRSPYKDEWDREVLQLE